MGRILYSVTFVEGLHERFKSCQTLREKGKMHGQLSEDVHHGDVVD